MIYIGKIYFNFGEKKIYRLLSNPLILDSYGKLKTSVGKLLQVMKREKERLKKENIEKIKYIATIYYSCLV